MGYTSDLTDAQWEQIKEYFPAGNKSKYDKSEPVNAVLYRRKNERTQTTYRNRYAWKSAVCSRSCSQFT